MRAMPIQHIRREGLWQQCRSSFRSNWKHYVQEALGLALFMISACLFSALLEAKDSKLNQIIADSFLRTCIMGLLMGGTALFIFYSPFTAPSGAHINPAVTLCFMRLGKISRTDTFFYCLFQFTGGTLAVYFMQWIMGRQLIDPPVSSVVTLPAAGIGPAAATEFLIAFATITIVLITSHHETLKKYTRVFAAFLVCVWVIVAGPVSGFGMNPARSFASALPSNIWTAFWIYLFMPVSGMILATAIYSYITTTNKYRYSVTPKRELQ